MRRICFESSQWGISQKSCSGTVNLSNLLHGTGTQQWSALSFGNNLQQRWKTPGWNFLFLFLCHIALTVDAFGYYRNRISPARFVPRQWLDVSLNTICIFLLLIRLINSKGSWSYKGYKSVYDLNWNPKKGGDHVGHLNVAGTIRVEINTEIEWEYMRVWAKFGWLLWIRQLLSITRRDSWSSERTLASH